MITPETDLFDRDLPIQSQSQPVWDWLLRAALVLFFIDIFVRRVAIRWRKLWPFGASAPEPALAGAGAAAGAATAVARARSSATPRRLEVGTVTRDEPESPEPTQAPAAASSGRAAKKAEKKAAKARAEEIPTVTSQLLRAKKAARKKTDDRS